MRITLCFFAVAMAAIVGAQIVYAAETPQSRMQAAISAGLSGEAAAKINWADPSTADLQCIPVIQVCGCGRVKSDGKCVGGTNKFLCKCTDPRGVSGFCADNFKCQATSATSLDGQSTGVDSGLSQLGQMLGQLMQQLMQGGGGSTGSPTAPGSSSTCPNGYYQVSAPSSDPCAQYVPPASTNIDTGLLTGSSGADALLQALTGSSGNIDTSSQAAADNTSTTDTTGTSGTSLNVFTQTTPTSNTMIPGIGSAAPFTLQGGGAFGNILLMPGGATIIGGTTDTQSNTTVSGFYGSDTFGRTEPKGLIAQMCESRPWASNFLSAIVSPSFFDSLCTWRGYQVGTPPPAPTLQQIAVPAQQNVAQSPATTTPAIPPRADIWASPASVPLDTRTSVFWNTQGVSDCIETSPSGSFNHSTLSGGAATVPITGATVFTISCIAPDGTPVTNSVTVDISI